MKGLSIALLVIMVVVVVAYAITIYELYKQEKWIFAPYQPKLLPNSCQPLIQVTRLTPDQVEARKAALQGGT